MTEIVCRKKIYEIFAKSGAGQGEIELVFAVFGDFGGQGGFLAELYCGGMYCTRGAKPICGSTVFRPIGHDFHFFRTRPSLKGKLAGHDLTGVL